MARRNVRGEALTEVCVGPVLSRESDAHAGGRPPNCEIAMVRNLTHLGPLSGESVGDHFAAQGGDGIKI